MSQIVWDQIGERRFESGIDRGVLYSPNHMIGVGWLGRPGGFPWNGLINVSETKQNVNALPVYFEGVKTFDIVSPGDFSAKIKAITYPDEFMLFDGFSNLTDGLMLDSQPRDTFGLSYRTLIGNDLDGIDLGYKLHILYNLSAVPSDVSRQTIDTNTAPIEFEWSVTGTPEIFPGHRPTAHLVLDSRTIHPESLVLVEEYLYGTVSEEPRLPVVADIVAMTCVVIEDNLDGTWTATGPAHLVEMLDADTFQIDGATIGTPALGDYTISSSYE